nr:hypothetical protein [uncultured Allomuricauda sp.]
MNPIKIIYETLSLGDWLSIGGILFFVFARILLLLFVHRKAKQLELISLFDVINNLGTALLYSIYYILIKFFVHPFSNILGIVLIVSLFLSIVLPPIWSIITPTLLHNKGAQNKTLKIIRVLSGISRLLYIGTLSAIIIFSFASNLVYSDIFNLKAKYSSEVDKITIENGNINKNLLQLNEKLDELQSVINNTKSNTRNLSKSINLLNERTKQVQIEKGLIENEIAELKLATEEEIKEEVSYRLVERIINGNFYSGLFIGLLISVLANKISPYIKINFKRKEEENY